MLHERASDLVLHLNDHILNGGAKLAKASWSSWQPSGTTAGMSSNSCSRTTCQKAVNSFSCLAVCSFLSSLKAASKEGWSAEQTAACEKLAAARKHELTWTFSLLAHQDTASRSCDLFESKATCQDLEHSLRSCTESATQLKADVEQAAAILGLPKRFLEFEMICLVLVSSATVLGHCDVLHRLWMALLHLDPLQLPSGQLSMPAMPSCYPAQDI